MRIIPVIDLSGGQVVHAVAGERDKYQPVISVLSDQPSPASIGQALAERIGATEIYVADLDALRGAPPAWAQYQQIAARGLRLWVDAGLSSRDRAAEFSQQSLHQSIISQVIVGLESVPSPADLADFLDLVGTERLIFSLDLRDGKPFTTNTAWNHMTVADIARVAVEVGVRSLIVLDLARVGTGQGVGTEALCRQLRERWPHMNLTAGGGIRNLQDLQTLARSGCNAALIASALHDGRFTAEGLRAAGYTVGSG